MLLIVQDRSWVENTEKFRRTKTKQATVNQVEGIAIYQNLHPNKKLKIAYVHGSTMYNSQDMEAT